MSACCDQGHDHGHFQDAAASRAYRRVLWFALIVNGGMFLGELAGAYLSKSVALQADALDFLGDAANYGISLAVVGMHLAWRARAAMVKGLSMGLFGLWVIGTMIWRFAEGGVPEAHIITGVGVLALVANVAVIVAGGGVWLTGTFWPDVAVGGIIAGLALFASAEVIRRAR